MLKSFENDLQVAMLRLRQTESDIVAAEEKLALTNIAISNSTVELEAIRSSLRKTQQDALKQEKAHEKNINSLKDAISLLEANRKSLEDDLCLFEGYIASSKKEGSETISELLATIERLKADISSLNASIEIKILQFSEVQEKVRGYQDIFTNLFSDVTLLQAEIIPRHEELNKLVVDIEEARTRRDNIRRREEEIYRAWKTVNLLKRRLSDQYLETYKQTLK